MAVNSNKRPINSDTPSLEIQELEAALREIQPQTKLGSRLIELSLKGLKAGVQPMTANEISEYLGRTRNHENLHLNCDVNC